MNKHSLIAIDLAKNIFQVCIVNSNNRVLVNRQHTRKSIGSDSIEMSILSQINRV